MSLEVTVRIPVALFGDKEWHAEEKIPNKIVTKTLTLPFDFVPSSLLLDHCLATRPIIEGGKKVLRLYVEIIGTQWDEATHTLFLQGQPQEWHDKSFATAIETMGEYGWNMVDMFDQ